MKRKRKTALWILTAAAAVSAAAAYGFDINPPVMNVAGSFAVIAAAAICGKLIKIPDGLFYTVLLFIFFASPVGSVLDLYRLWDPYDKIVHLASGMLLGAAGFALAVWLFEKIGVSAEKGILVIVLITFLASSAGAGIWEIFEFTVDKIAGGGMQRGMVDTLTDMIAGNIGGLFYSAFAYRKIRRRRYGGAEH